MTKTDWKTFIQYIYDNLDQIIKHKYTYDDYTLLMVDNSQKNPDNYNDDIGLDTDYISQIPENLLSVLEVDFLLNNDGKMSGGGDDADTRDHMKNFFQTIVDEIMKLPQSDTKNMILGGLAVLFIVVLLIYLCYLFYKSRKKTPKSSSQPKSFDESKTPDDSKLSDEFKTPDDSKLSDKSDASLKVEKVDEDGDLIMSLKEVKEMLAEQETENLNEPKSSSPKSAFDRPYYLHRL